MFARLLASQLGRPRGRFGRALAHLLNRGNRDMNRRAVAHLDVRTGHRLLDVGFGGGVGMEAMFDVVGSLFVAGLDYAPDMVQQQRRRFAGRIGRGQMQLEHGDVTAMPFGDADFDRVLSCNTIYFWAEPVVALREILRVLRPGGRLVLGCATKEQLQRSPVFQHGFRHHDEAAVRALLREAGFRGIEIARSAGEPMFFAIAHRPDDASAEPRR